MVTGSDLSSQSYNPWLPGTFLNMLPWQLHLTQNNANSASLEGQAHFVAEQDTGQIFKLWRPGYYWKQEKSNGIKQETSNVVTANKKSQMV